MSRCKKGNMSIICASREKSSYMCIVCASIMQGESTSIRIRFPSRATLKINYGSCIGTCMQ